MLPIEIEVVSGPPLEELFAQEGNKEVQFLVTNRGGEKKLLAGRIVSMELDGVVTVLFDGDSYRGTLFEGLYDSKLCCRGRLFSQLQLSRGT